MGMFDYVHYQGIEYQSKDTPSQLLDHYHLLPRAGAESGENNDTWELWVEDYDVVDMSDHNAKGLNRLIGSMTRVSKGLIKTNFTGAIEFYLYNSDDKTEIIYNVILENGVQKYIQRHTKGWNLKQ